MKAVCIIASDNVVVNGDVVFNIQKKSGLDYSYKIHDVNNIFIINTVTTNRIPWIKAIKPSTRIYLCSLWFWHMVILRKSHVYLTGVLK